MDSQSDSIVNTSQSIINYKSNDLKDIRQGDIARRSLFQIEPQTSQSTHNNKFNGLNITVLDGDKDLENILSPKIVDSPEVTNKTNIQLPKPIEALTSSQNLDQILPQNNNSQCIQNPTFSQYIGLHQKQSSRYFNSGVLNKFSMSKYTINRQQTKQSDLKTLKNQKQEKWKGSALNIIVYVISFIHSLKLSISNKRFQNLTERHFEILGDVSANFRYYKTKQNQKFMEEGENLQKTINLQNVTEKQKQLQKLVEIQQKISNKQKNILQQYYQKIFDSCRHFWTVVPVFSPNSTYKVCWDLLVLFFLTITLFYIPFLIAFVNYGKPRIAKWLSYTLNEGSAFVFLLDIIINFNTAIYKKGIIENNRQEIIKCYIKGNFSWDISILSVFYISVYFEIPILQAILLLRSLQMTRIANKVVFQTNLMGKLKTIYELSKLIFIIIYIGHLFGCAFNFIQELEKEYGFAEITWVDRVPDLDQKLWHEKYVASVYFSIITMITVGYGDIYPVNYIERLCVIVITLVSSGLFAYSVNQISEIISDMSKKNQQFQKKMAIIVNQMKFRQINIELQQKIKKYFEYLNNDDDINLNMSELFLNQLEPNLQKEVIQDIYKKILMKYKFFKLNFSNQFIEKLSLCVKEQKFGPQSVIFKEQDQNNNIYFIISGKVEEYIKIKNTNNKNLGENINGYTKIRSVQQNESMNEWNFFSGRNTSTGAISINVVTLGYITQKDFIETIKKFEKDSQIYYQFKDNLNLYNNSRGLSLMCQLCDSYYHSIDICPYIKFISKNDQVIQKYNQMDEPQIRKYIIRNNNRIISTLLNQELIRDQAIDFLLNENENMGDNEEALIEKLQNIQTAHKQYNYYNTDENNTFKSQIQLNQFQLAKNNKTPQIKPQDNNKQGPSWKQLNNSQSYCTLSDDENSAIDKTSSYSKAITPNPKLQNQTEKLNNLNSQKLTNSQNNQNNQDDQYYMESLSSEFQQQNQVNSPQIPIQSSNFNINQQMRSKGRISSIIEQQIDTNNIQDIKKNAKERRTSILQMGSNNIQNQIIQKSQNSALNMNMNTSKQPIKKASFDSLSIISDGTKKQNKMYNSKIKDKNKENFKTQNSPLLQQISKNLNQQQTDKSIFSKNYQKLDSQITNKTNQAGTNTIIQQQQQFQFNSEIIQQNQNKYSDLKKNITPIDQMFIKFTEQYNSFSGYDNFDKYCIWTYYFPKFNIDNILKNYNKRISLYQNYYFSKNEKFKKLEQLIKSRSPQKLNRSSQYFTSKLPRQKTLVLSTMQQEQEDSTYKNITPSNRILNQISHNQLGTSQYLGGASKKQSIFQLNQLDDILDNNCNNSQNIELNTNYQKQQQLQNSQIQKSCSHHDL